MKTNSLDNRFDEDFMVKAYNNYEFLNSPQARLIRILAEMIEPDVRLRKHSIKNTVVFFGSARLCSPTQTRKAVKEIQHQI
jgi:hypothetical protein